MISNVKNITKLNETELAKGTIDKKSWHDLYKDSAWIFIGGLAYGLTEGDIITVFSQYGEIVNINLVRDKKTGKTKGFCFLCYANQKSTVLAVDNFNGIKLCGRTIRVDHVANYKPPKENEHDDELTKMLKSEGCAPKLIKQEPPDNRTEEKHKKKKSKKEKKHKKKKKQSETDSPIHIKVEMQDPSYDSSNVRTECTEQNRRSAKEMYAKDLKRLEKLQQESESDADDMSKSRNKNKCREVSSSRYENYEFPSSTKSDNHRNSSPQRKKSDKSHNKHHTLKNSKSSKGLTGKNAFILSSEEKYETHKNIQKKKGKRDYHNEPSSSSTDSDSGSRDKYSHKKDAKKHKRHDTSSSSESSQERQFHFKNLRDNQLREKKRYKSHENEKYSADSHRRYDYNKHYDKEEKSHTNKHRQYSTTSEVNKNGALSCHDKYKSVNKRTSRNDDYDQYNHSVNRKKHCRNQNTER
ncbi:RNA-binding motif protein, X-linked 2-like isoform X2 [Stegodyphus dumicola]|uniref:RNA-binding motif protein, X-linked 2-like isoform X2 n=1 Tax=Stegodyphus dumicola TaxID=202533 RepID=UPI0015A833DD|nr:RNA-binding motif protein, X-linked 2-like isoform X2 [Stegodyphus dumicola]